MKRGIVVAVIMGLIGGAGAFAAFDPVGADDDIDACFARKSGDLDLLKGAQCGKGEKPVAWSRTGPPGPAGAAGETGPPGEAGAPGRSALEELRSGEAVHGTVGANEPAPAADEEYRVLETLPVPAPEPLTNQNVIVDGVYEGTTTCTGDFANPTAPPGFVCIYGAHASVGLNSYEEEGIAAAFSDGATPYGFALRWYSETAGDTRVYATWAYTAP